MKTLKSFLSIIGAVLLSLVLVLVLFPLSLLGDLSHRPQDHRQGLSLPKFPSFRKNKTKGPTNEDEP